MEVASANHQSKRRRHAKPKVGSQHGSVGIQQDRNPVEKLRAAALKISGTAVPGSRRKDRKSMQRRRKRKLPSTLETAVFNTPVGASRSETDDDIQVITIAEGLQGSIASCWLRRTRDVEGKIGIPGRCLIYPVGGEPGARVISIAPGGLCKQITWSAGQTRVERELLAEVNEIT